MDLIYNLNSSSLPLYILQPISCSSNLDGSFSQDEQAYAVDSKIVDRLAKSILQNPSIAQLNLKQTLDRAEKNFKKYQLIQLIKIVIKVIVICFCLLVPVLILAIFIFLRTLNIFHMITIFFLLGLAISFLIVHHIRNPIDNDCLTKIYFTEIVDHIVGNILSYIPKSQILFATEMISAVMYNLSYTGQENDRSQENSIVSIKCFDERYPSAKNIAQAFPIYHCYLELPVKPQTTETRDIFKYADSLRHIVENFKSFHLSTSLTKENRELSIQQIESFVNGDHLEWFVGANEFIRLHLDRIKYPKDRLEKYKQERQKLLDDALNWLTQLFLYVPDSDSFSMPFFHSLEGFLSSSEWVSIEESKEKDLLYIGLLRFSYDQQYNIFLSFIRGSHIFQDKDNFQRDNICQKILYIIEHVICSSTEPIVHSLLKTAMHTYETSYNLEIEDSSWYQRHLIRVFFSTYHSQNVHGEQE